MEKELQRETVGPDSSDSFDAKNEEREEKRCIDRGNGSRFVGGLQL